ncbi:flagellar motor switch protein FliG [Capsulimonas corticalis]|uniref:Flagellar motor switch protein FliG n=1 Tax=Capsulimonas corticalis TaxID=2219043 RepID=A0A402CSZ7_9BACT|nr:flagellar motor switch protein FliG [Capsulimonas corticalis]BDI30916.1 flagellar motor switch protein FliG [Capsulimonas corticalis]
MAIRPQPLNNRQKAAILLVALGPESASQIYQYLTPDEIENLTVEIARMGKVTADIRETIIEEFHELCVAQEFIAEGGIDAAREMLITAFGAERAGAIVDRVLQALQVMPFDFLKKADASQIATFIQNEHPQTIALIMAYLQPSQAAAILSGLPQDLRAEVARRIATLDKTPPEVIREVESVLQRKLSSVVSTDFSHAGGVKSLVDVLNWVDRSTEKTILESLAESNPEIAEEVKKLMFVFEDIILLDDRAIQQVLKEVDTKELAVALKGVGENTQARIYKNMSERAAAMMKEEMEFMGPVRLRAVEESQQRIVNIIRKLEEAGEIIVARGGGEEMIA